MLVEYTARFGSKKEDTKQGTFYASDSIVKKDGLLPIAEEYVSKTYGKKADKVSATQVVESR
jgi:hypothetical protein